MTTVYFSITSLTSYPRKIGLNKKTKPKLKETVMSRMNSILSAIIVVLMLYPSFAQNKNLFAEVEAAEQQKSRW
jgi:hypothetical protein